MPDVPANKLPEVDVADRIPSVPTHIPESSSGKEGKEEQGSRLKLFPENRFSNDFCFVLIAVKPSREKQAMLAS